MIEYKHKEREFMNDNTRFMFAVKLDNLNHELRKNAEKLEELHNKIQFYTSKVDTSNNKLTLKLIKDYTDEVKKAISHIDLMLEIFDDILDMDNDDMGDDEDELTNTMTDAEGLLDETKDAIMNVFCDDLLELLQRKM